MIACIKAIVIASLNLCKEYEAPDTASTSIIKCSETRLDLKYLSSGLKALIPSRLSSLQLQESHDDRNRSGTIKRIAGIKDRLVLFCVSKIFI